MGIPAEDQPQIHAWAEQNTSGQDPDLTGSEDGSGYQDGGGNASMEMAMYAIGFAARRRAEPAREDLTSLILAGNFGGQPMSDVDFGSFFVQLVTAGNDTTKTMLASGSAGAVGAPGPAGRAAGRSVTDPRGGRGDPAVGQPAALLPPHGDRRHRRCAACRSRAGDKVAMYYTSANRDEDVFADPHGFDIHRDPNPHLSFGIAEHFCLGVHLARLEGKVFLEELLGTFRTIELTEPPRRTRSNLNNALKAMPVRLAA